MPRIWIARRATRRGFLLPMSRTKLNPSLLFPLYKTDPGELDELVRAMLQKQGVGQEAQIHALVQEAEEQSEKRIKIAEAQTEVRRLMSLRAKGARLMQLGFRKWKEAFYRPRPTTD